MVERKEQSDQLPDFLDISGNPAESMEIPVKRKHARHSVIATLASKPTALELLSFAQKPEIRELPEDFRVLQIASPAFEEEETYRFMRESDLAKPLSTAPLIRSPESKVSMIQALVTSPAILSELRERTTEEGLHLNIRVSPPAAPILHVCGAAGLLKQEFQTEDQGVERSLIPWPEYEPPGDRGFSEKASISRMGPCSYLIFDLNIKDESPPWPEILGHLDVLSQSTDFSFHFDQAGNLVIVALNERAIGRLSLWAEAVRKFTGGKSSLFLGKGNITRTEQHQLFVQGYLSKGGLMDFRNAGRNRPGIYSQAGMLGQIKDSRDETIVKLEAGDVAEDANSIVPLQVNREVNFHVGGGPDRLVGFREEYGELLEGVSQNFPSRLFFLEGEAGAGKSRLINEVSRHTSNTVKISIDPAGRNIAGFSLVDFADQLALYLQRRVSESNAQLPPSVKGLLDYVRKSENEKLLEANKFTDTICFYFSRSLDYLEENFGPQLLLLDDAHHIDRYSDEPLMNVIGTMLDTDLGSSKAVVMRRADERYASFHQENLKRRVKSGTVSLHKADGSPKLDFKDRNIAEEYILYSLPENIRVNPENGQNRILGEWAYELAAKCRTPFELTSYLQEIIGRPEFYLHVQKDHLEMSIEGRERIKIVQGMEMKVYHLARMKELLSEDSLVLLQVLVLLGQKFASAEAICGFMEEAFEWTRNQTGGLLAELVQQGYLIGREDEGKMRYSVWHETISDTVMNHTMDQEGRSHLANRVYRVTLGHEELSDQQKFLLLDYASGAHDTEDFDFWNEYTSWGRKAIAEAEEQNLYAQGYNLALLILNDLDLKNSSRKVVLNALDRMTKGESVEPNTESFALTTLLSCVRNGYYLGQYAKVYQSIEIAEKIAANRPDLDLDLGRFYVVGFETAYAQINTSKLKDYHSKLFRRIGQFFQKGFDLKLAYRTNDFAKCRTILEALEAELGLSDEIARLKIRIELEGIYDELRQAGVDGDAIPSGLDLSDEQLKKVVALQEQLGELKHRLRKRLSEGGVPRRLPPVDELHMLDIEAQTDGLLGKYNNAIRRFAESWRVAMQMDVPAEACRAAKQKGDLEVIHAMTSRPNRKSKLFYRPGLKAAVQTYTEEGIKVAEKLPDQLWQFLLRVQRLRATCLLILTYDADESCNLHEELFGLFDLASEDVKFINSANWASLIPNADGCNLTNADYETCYYITPFMFLYRRLCQDHEYQTGGEQELPYETAWAHQCATFYAIDMKEDDFRERGRKMEALNLKFRTKK